jgi:hypothetical protein
MKVSLKIEDTGIGYEANPFIRRFLAKYNPWWSVVGMSLHVLLIFILSWFASWIYGEIIFYIFGIFVTGLFAFDMSNDLYVYFKYR